MMREALVRTRARPNEFEAADLTSLRDVCENESRLVVGALSEQSSLLVFSRSIPLSDGHKYMICKEKSLAARIAGDQPGTVKVADQFNLTMPPQRRPPFGRGVSGRNLPPDKVQVSGLARQIRSLVSFS